MEDNKLALTIDGVDIRDLGAVIHESYEYFGIEVTNCTQEVKDAIKERMLAALGINTASVIYDRSGL